MSVVMSRSAVGAIITLMLSQPFAADAVRGVSVAENDFESRHARKGKIVLSQSKAACQTDKINELVSQNEPANLPWNEIMPYADNFIEAQTRDIAQLEEDEQSLLKLIAEHQGEASQDELAPADAAALITEALKPLEVDGESLKNFGSATIAVRTKCGGDMFSEDADAAMLEAGLELDDLLVFYDDDSVLEKALAAAFKQRFAGGVAVNPKVVTEACESTLGVSADSKEDPDNFCPRLCSKLVEKATSLSSGFKTRSDVQESTKNSLAQVQNALGLARSSKAACEKKKQDLEALREQLEAITTLQKTADRDRIQSRIKCKGAMMQLKKYKELVQEQENKMKALYELLEKLGIKVDESRKHLRLATEKRDHLDSETKKGEARLMQIEADLEKMLIAIEAATDLRSRVIGILLRMTVFYEEMVRDPIRALGVTLESRVQETFAEKQADTLGAELSENLQGIAQYCGDEVTVRDLKGGKVDASALCQVGDATAIEKEIKETANQRQAAAIQRFLEIQGELDVYKGQGSENVKELEATGKQLAGFAEVFATYADTDFYREYLQKWELSGAFKKITDAMHATMVDLEDAHYKESELLAALRKQLEEAEAEVRAAEEALAAVEKELADTQAVTAEEAKKFEELKRIKAEKEEALKQFMQLCRTLDEDMKAINDKLKEAHAQHVNMQSFFQALENSRRLQ